MGKKQKSLSGLLRSAFLLFSGIVLLLLIFMDWYLIRSYQMQKRQQEFQALETAADQVHADMQQINYMLYNIYENNDDFKALSGHLSSLERFSHAYDLNESLKMQLALEDYLHGHFILYNNGQNSRYFIDQDVISSDDIYELRIRIQECLRETTSGRSWCYTVANGSRYALLSARKQNVGLCLIYNLSSIETNLLKSMPAGCELFFVETGGALGHGEQTWEQSLLTALNRTSDRYSLQIEGKYISAFQIGKNDLWLCMSVPVDLFFYMSPGQLVLLFLTLLVFFALQSIHKRVDAYMIVPLRRLAQTMDQIRDGHWEAKVESSNYEEIRMVNDALEAMLGEIKKQKILSYEHMLEKQQTQMRFLQLQLKPHFYLNGLKTLNALVIEEDWQSTQDVIIGLSEHMRYLLQAERELVPLQAEVDFVKNYTQLQSLMTGRPVDVHWNLKHTTRNWQVPVLCIQTFLENSFKYARIGNLQKKLQLRITVQELETEEGAYLDISVRDNGQGYPEGILASINDVPEGEGTGVGIKNLLRRCALLYGGDAQHNFYNDDGAVSELILPWREDAYEYPDRG